MGKHIKKSILKYKHHEKKTRALPVDILIGDPC